MITIILKVHLCIWCPWEWKFILIFAIITEKPGQHVWSDNATVKTSNLLDKCTMTSVSHQSYWTSVFSVCFMILWNTIIIIVSMFTARNFSALFFFCSSSKFQELEEVQLSVLFQTIFLAYILFSIPVQLPSLWQSFIHLQSVDIKIQSCFSLLGPTYRNLPPHPNVCPVLGAFADNTPCLPDARNSYSAALPRQYGEGCFGRNRTMFFVMPRLG